MLRELRKSNPGIGITILVATGMHRASTASEREEKFGKEICGKERIVVWTEFRSLSSVGKVAPMGDFDLWNELKARGHDIQPHGHRHECFQHYPFEEAQDMIRLCLDMFRENLQGFEPEKAVFR
jgi:hypothetical protein